MTARRLAWFGLAFYLLKGNPYLASGPAREIPREAVKDTAKAWRSDAGTAEKPRFDFYKILPGVEEPRVQAKSGEPVAHVISRVDDDLPGDILARVKSKDQTIWLLQVIDG